MKTRIIYIENKATGEARIGRVTFSRTWQTVYYLDKVLQRAGSGGIRGNFVEAASGHEYWVSGCKRRGADYHWAERVPVHIDEDVRQEYWATIRA